MLHICDKLNKQSCRQTECECADYHLEYIPRLKEATDGWIKVKESNWTIDEILNKTTLIGLLNNLREKIDPTDSTSRWSLAEKVFTCYSSIFLYNKTRFAYLKNYLDLSLDENVQLVEMRRFNFGDLYYFNEQGEKVFLSANEELKMLRQFKSDYARENSKFIDFVYIIQSIRTFSNDNIKQELELAIEAHKSFPDMVKGFDLVSEEDEGNTLLYYNQVLLKGFNYILNSNSSFGFYFHNVETSWPSDFPTKDNNHASVDENIYDAILFKSKRIGHGLGIIKHPKLNSYFVNNKIAIELCPTSNQILGFIPDIRNHPGLNYLKSGLPILIGSDDPGSFGYNDLTVDYYLVFMSWGLSLFDLREIANNSIRYSSISDSMKSIGFNKFERAWNLFIDETYENICGTHIYNDYSKISLKTVYSFFDADQKIKFKIYGHGFENLLCIQVECLFNKSIKTRAHLTNWRELICERPKDDLSNQKVYLSLLVNETRIDGLSFNYF
jgi:adenosine deaminase CECR1